MFFAVFCFSFFWGLDLPKQGTLLIVFLFVFYLFIHFLFILNDISKWTLQGKRPAFPAFFFVPQILSQKINFARTKKEKALESIEKEKKKLQIREVFSAFCFQAHILLFECSST